EEQRDHSRMMVLGRNSGEITDRHFYDLFDYLRPGDCLILNDSRVLPARIFGVKCGGESVNEFLLLRQIEPKVWETITKPGKRAKVGARFDFSGVMQGEVIEVKEDGNRVVRFDCDGEFFSLLDTIGQMPLPPYITEELKDRERYQTVYSRELGSAAAPTAGLHFTQEMLERLRAAGVNIGFVTLHVGLGTFRPVKVDDIAEHKMHSEHYYLPAETAELINETKRRGGRVISVGTTSCRTLESCGTEDGVLHEQDGWTEIFIYPGYKFKVIDGLITNFHLPESTLIMLVSAFAGYDNTMNAYKSAVEKEYRFFSFGDAMLIL
ncbi:MAG: tRNA preQ1(34) S-adenosylmethionine ribosyltransferase-isomerase QueA, partial [Clostridia bacterium]|nr:tRNA preQ1(34) S-adenosylmethionine ribosyltransferase-isomerase QueA [Clostridia bacterium]